MGQVSMKRFLAVFERDLRKFVRNPIVVLVSILMPIIYLVILGSSFQGDLKRLPVAVVDQDGGPHGRRILELLRGVEAGPGTVELFRVSDPGFAREALGEGLFKAVVFIPPDFTRDVERDTYPEIGVMLDNADTISSETLRGVFSNAVGAFRTEFIPVRKDHSEIRVRFSEIYKKIDYDQTLIPGVVIMAIFLGSMMTGAFNMVMDRFLGVEESYFLTPVTKRDIVMGLVASGLLITTILAVVVLAASSVISGVYLWRILTLKSLGMLLLVIVLATLGLQGLMFIIMGRIGHPRIVGVLGGFLNVIFFFPSGAIYPVESFPGWLKAFAVVNPETYSVHALRAVLFKGAGFEAVLSDLAFLAAFAAVSIAAGTLLFKRVL